MCLTRLPQEEHGQLTRFLRTHGAKSACCDQDDSDDDDDGDGGGNDDDDDEDGDDKDHDDDADDTNDYGNVYLEDAGEDT